MNDTFWCSSLTFEIKLFLMDVLIIIIGICILCDDILLEQNNILMVNMKYLTNSEIENTLLNKTKMSKQFIFNAVAPLRMHDNDKMAQIAYKESNLNENKNYNNKENKYENNHLNESKLLSNKGNKCENNNSVNNLNGLSLQWNNNEFAQLENNVNINDYYRGYNEYINHNNNCNNILILKKNPFLSDGYNKLQIIYSQCTLLLSTITFGIILLILNNDNIKHIATQKWICGWSIQSVSRNFLSVYCLYKKHSYCACSVIWNKINMINDYLVTINE